MSNLEQIEADLADKNRLPYGVSDAVVRSLIEEVRKARAAPSEVAAIVPEHCSGSAFVFDPGVLHVNKDGSGYIAIDEDDFTLEDDRCEGPDGPEGSVHWIARLPEGQMTALRDFLNGCSFSTPDDDLLRQAIEALTNSCDLLENYIDTFGDMSGANRADLNDYRAVLALAAKRGL